jgi:hypothetical protein
MHKYRQMLYTNYTHTASLIAGLSYTPAITYCDLNINSIFTQAEERDNVTSAFVKRKRISCTPYHTTFVDIQIYCV